MLTRERAGIVQRLLNSWVFSKLLLSDESEAELVQDLIHFFDKDPSTADVRKHEFLQAGFSKELIESNFGRCKVLHINFGELNEAAATSFDAMLKAICSLLKKPYQDIAPKLTDKWDSIEVLTEGEELDFTKSRHCVWLQNALRNLRIVMAKIEKMPIVLIVTDYDRPYTLLKSQDDKYKMQDFLSHLFLSACTDYIYGPKLGFSLLHCSFLIGSTSSAECNLLNFNYVPFALSDLRKDVAKKVRSDQPEHVSGNPYSVYPLPPSAEQSDEQPALGSAPA